MSGTATATSFYRGEDPLRADKLNQAFSERVALAGDTMGGPLILSGDPIERLGAVTKQYVDQRTFGASQGGLLQVGQDKRLYDQNGNRLLIKSVTMNANTFALFGDGYRFDWGIRNSQNANNIATVSPSINRGTIYGRWLSYTYQDSPTWKAYVNNIKQYGFNCIRTWIGIGMRRTAAFQDPVTLLQIPQEMSILDDMVKSTQELGMTLWLTFGQGSVPDSQLADFWSFIAQRYNSANNLMFDIQNEPGSGTVFATPSNPTQTTPYSTIMPNIIAWKARFEPCLAAIRGAGFRGPVGVQPLSNLWSIDTIQFALNNPPWSLDPNLFVCPHMYYIWQDVATTFASQRLNWDAHITNFARYFCIVFGEFGPSNAYNYINPQPALDFTTEALGWAQKECFNGMNTFTAQPLSNHYNDIWDNTTAFLQLGNLTAWGQALMDYHNKGTNGMVKMVPDIQATVGTITSTAGSDIRFHRDSGGERYDVEALIVVPSNGSGAQRLLLRLPSPAPTDRIQRFSGKNLTTSTSVDVNVIGNFAEIVKSSDVSYPVVSGDVVSTSFTYFAANNNQGLGFAFAPEVFANDHWYTRGGGLTGAVDGKQGTIITTIDMHTGTDNTTQRIWTSTGSTVALFRNTSNKLTLQLRNAAGTLIGALTSSILTNEAAVKHTIFCSWDLAAGFMLLFIKGVNFTDTTPGAVTIVDDFIDYTVTNWSLGALSDGTERLSADMDFFIFDPTFWQPGNYLNNGAFFDMFDNPVDFGRYAEAMFGGRPMVCLRKTDSANPFRTNWGTGGAFVSNP